MITVDKGTPKKRNTEKREYRKIHKKKLKIYKKNSVKHHHLNAFKRQTDCKHGANITSNLVNSPTNLLKK